MGSDDKLYQLDGNDGVLKRFRIFMANAFPNTTGVADYFCQHIYRPDKMDEYFRLENVAVTFCMLVSHKFPKSKWDKITVELKVNIVRDVFTGCSSSIIGEVVSAVEGWAAFRIKSEASIKGEDFIVPMLRLVEKLVDRKNVQQAIKDVVRKEIPPGLLEEGFGDD